MARPSVNNVAPLSVHCDLGPIVQHDPALFVQHYNMALPCSALFVQNGPAMFVQHDQAQFVQSGLAQFVMPIHHFFYLVGAEAP